MRQKLFSKFFFAAAAVVLVSISCALLILTFVYNNYLANQKHSALKKSCESIINSVDKIYLKGYELIEDKGLYYMMNNLAQVSEIDMYITDIDGVVRLCGCSDFGDDLHCDHKGMQFDDDMLVEFTAREKNLSTMGVFNSLYYVEVETLSLEGNTQGYIISAASATDVKKLMLSALRLYAFSAIVPIIFMFVGLYVASKRVTRPLKMMSEASKAMAKGDFSRRIPVSSDDEIGALAVSFNQMTNSLARLEEMRKSFVANISHEFKTPLTTIGGFIDGIIDGTIEADKREYYLNIVSDEVKRLSRMVESMLSIVKLESGEFTIKNEKFDFRELVLNIAISQEQRIEKKNIDIIGLDALNPVTITADKDLIHRAVYNLVDNAIKFTDENGQISFCLKQDGRSLSFTIKNSGRGIPQSELPFVFDRFYKVDKSRSANKTSTGLGLYMVKTILKNHGGRISVSSIENEFTAFEISIPIKNSRGE